MEVLSIKSKKHGVVTVGDNISYIVNDSTTVEKHSVISEIGWSVRNGTGMMMLCPVYYIIYLTNLGDTVQEENVLSITKKSILKDIKVGQLFKFKESDTVYIKVNSELVDSSGVANNAGKFQNHVAVKYFVTCKQDNYFGKDFPGIKLSETVLCSPTDEVECLSQIPKNY